MQFRSVDIKCKIMKAKDLVKAIGLIVVCFAGMILLFDVILHFPVKAQKYAGPPVKIGERTSEDIEAELKNPEPTYQEHENNINRLPQFTPPPDNHLTEDQIHRYHNVVVYCWDRVSEFRRTYVGVAQDDFVQLAALYGFGGIMFKLALIEGVDSQHMRFEEYDWVQARLYEAALFAANRKWEMGKFTPEEKPVLEAARDQLAFMLGLEDEKTGKTLPEKLEIKNIPRTNVQLFLKFKEEARYQRVDFSKVQFDEQDIMSAAQVLPE